MLDTVFGDQIIEGSPGHHQHNTDQDDEVFVNLIKQRVPNPKFDQLSRVNPEIKLFIVDNVLATWTDPQPIGAGGYLADALGPRVVLSLIYDGRVFVGVIVASDRHIRWPRGDVTRMLLLIRVY